MQYTMAKCGLEIKIHEPDGSQDQLIPIQESRDPRENKSFRKRAIGFQYVKNTHRGQEASYRDQ